MSNRFLLILTGRTGNRGTLHTCDPSVASRWIVNALGTMERGDYLAVLINGVDRGSRIAARLMSLSESAVSSAIEAECLALRKVA